MKRWILGLTAVLAGTVPALADWNSVGSVKFSGNESQTFMLPSTAHGMTTVGLRPEGDSARCTHVSGTFANGQTKQLTLNPPVSTSTGFGEYLPRGEVTTVSIPGDQDMTQLELTCHGEAGAKVTIDILAG